MTNKKFRKEREDVGRTHSASIRCPVESSTCRKAMATRSGCIFVGIAGSSCCLALDECSSCHAAVDARSCCQLTLVAVFDLSEKEIIEEAGPTYPPARISDEAS